MFKKHRVLCLFALSALISSTSSQYDEEAIANEGYDANMDEVPVESKDHEDQDHPMPPSDGEGPKMMQMSPMKTGAEKPKIAPVEGDVKPVGMETPVKTKGGQEEGELSVKGADSNKKTEKSKPGNGKETKKIGQKPSKKGTQQQQKKKAKATEVKNKKNQQAVGAKNKAKTGAGVKKQVAKKAGNVQPQQQQHKKKIPKNGNNGGNNNES